MLTLCQVIPPAVRNPTSAPGPEGEPPAAEIPAEEPVAANHAQNSTRELPGTSSRPEERAAAENQHNGGDRSTDPTPIGPPQGRTLQREGPLLAPGPRPGTPGAEALDGVLPAADAVLGPEAGSGVLRESDPRPEVPGGGASEVPAAAAARPAASGHPVPAGVRKAAAADATGQKVAGLTAGDGSAAAVSSGDTAAAMVMDVVMAPPASSGSSKDRNADSLTQPGRPFFQRKLACVCTAFIMLSMSKFACFCCNRAKENILSGYKESSILGQTKLCAALPHCPLIAVSEGIPANTSNTPDSTQARL